MSACSSNKILYMCMTHLPLEINFPYFVTPLYLGEAQGPGKLNLRDLAPDWELHHTSLGATAGAFAMKNYLLSNLDDYTHIGICQYRKFISHEKIGIQAENYQVMDLVTIEKLSEVNLEILMLPLTSDYLIGNPGKFHNNGKDFSYLYQYKDTHFIEDLLVFTATAVELGVLDKNEVCLFFDEEIFFPGGIELGVMPKDFWINNITSIELVVRECVNKYSRKRVGSQSRVWAFCSERLGSYFLIRQLRAQALPNMNWLDNHTGQLNLLVSPNVNSYVPGF